MRRSWRMLCQSFEALHGDMSRWLSRQNMVEYKVDGVGVGHYELEVHVGFNEWT
jgi:hypothetical protein